MSLPNPQLMADAQALNVFAQAISQAAVKLVNSADESTPEFIELKNYFNDNLPKLRAIMDRLDNDLG